jgi:hypothetical protein
MSTVSRAEGQHLVSLQVMSANLTFKINYHSDTEYPEKSTVSKGCKFSFYALKFIGASNRNMFPSKRSIPKLWFYSSKVEHQKLYIT